MIPPYESGGRVEFDLEDPQVRELLGAELVDYILERRKEPGPYVGTLVFTGVDYRPLKEILEMERPADE